MPINWDAEPDAEQVAFERAAIEAARGWVQTLDELDEARQRIAKLERQVAVLVGLDDPR